MKTNYNLIMEDIINKLENKPKLLLHACCGVCSSAVLEKINKYFDITILFYNPNIYPETEYNKRLETQKDLIDKMKLNIKLMNVEYDPETFNNISKGREQEKEGGERCTKCYLLRLEKTAKLAKLNNFDYFCTTLSISPYKNAEKLNKIGHVLEEKYQIKYLYSDFKKKDGYKRSTELAKQYNLYRQDYCGCEYSLKESKEKQKEKQEIQ